MKKQDRAIDGIIEKLVQKELCLGCGICESCFSDKLSVKLLDGYYKPIVLDRIESNEVEEFKSICPALNQEYNFQNDKRKFKKELGYYINYYHGYSTDKKIQYESSTGGGITSFLTYLLQENIVDAVLQIKAGEDAFTCSTVVSKTAEESIACKGSRYAPSCLFTDFKNILDQFSKLCIVGKPCDLRAVHNFISTYPQYRDRIFLKINFLCGGVPKLQGTYKVLEALGCKDFEIVDKIIYRGYGWPGEFTATLKNSNSNLRMSYDDSWGKYLGPNVLLGCKICVDSVGEYADITFGDGWNTDERGFPIFNEGDGTDLIITRSQLADRLLLESKAKNYLYVQKADSEEFKKVQPSQYIRRTTALYKLKGAQIMGLPSKYINWEYIKSISEKNIPMKKKVRTFLGTVRRIRSCNNKKSIDIGDKVHE